MPSHIVSDHTSTSGTHAGKLHVCILDGDGQVCTSNYPLGTNKDLPLPDVIRLAYGVTPHPDMPDAIYNRMEHRIKTESGAAGFYLCQTSEGHNFWISVNFFNSKNGRAVCHFAVSSPVVKEFADFYSHIKSAEHSAKGPQDQPARPAEQSQADISKYRTLAVTIMSEELTKRTKGRDCHHHNDFISLHNILSALVQIDDYAKRIDGMSARSKLIPYQLKLQAARLEGGRGPFGVIASNHQELTQSLLGITDELRGASSSEVDAVMDAMAYLAQSTLAAELIETDQVDNCIGDIDAESTLAELEYLIADCSLQIMTLLARVDRSILKLAAICHRMRRSLSAMETTRMMCKIERSRLSDGAEGLMDIEDQLHQVHADLLKWMTKIEREADNALQKAQDMKDARKQKAA
ncbi:hypothetical protein [Ascidiaceihabitans sp.]|uniref:hypothetical protein n=1 Tax=Ascidiaceihabitans sp. TaxID=1872644 RepID=UPI003297D843